MNKTIVVIGASRGIGRELVLHFAKEESNTVIALARNEKALSYFESFKNVVYAKFDLASETVREDLKKILTNYSVIDIAINNAGTLVNKPFLDLTSEDLSISYQVNALGVIQSVQALVSKMLDSGGHIVNISTMGAFQGSAKFAGLTAYSTSKAAVTCFTELFAEEYKETKLKMNCLCLGAAQTEMLEEAFPGYKAPISAKEMAKYIHDFSLTAHHYMNGKIIPVSLSTP